MSLYVCICQLNAIFWQEQKGEIIGKLPLNSQIYSSTQRKRRITILALDRFLSGCIHLVFPFNLLIVRQEQLRADPTTNEKLYFILIGVEHLNRHADVCISRCVRIHRIKPFKQVALTISCVGDSTLQSQIWFQ